MNSNVQSPFVVSKTNYKRLFSICKTVFMLQRLFFLFSGILTQEVPTFYFMLLLLGLGSLLPCFCLSRSAFVLCRKTSLSEAHAVVGSRPLGVFAP